jgi:hypothetical protein
MAHLRIAEWGPVDGRASAHRFTSVFAQNSNMFVQIWPCAERSCQGAFQQWAALCRYLKSGKRQPVGAWRGVCAQRCKGNKNED